MEQHLFEPGDISRIQAAVAKRGEATAPVEAMPPQEITKRVIYEAWSLNSSGNGTVTYRRYAPDGGEPRWANEVGRVVERVKGGTFLAGERNARSIAEITFRRGAVKEEIEISYKRGAKSGRTNTLSYLHGWDSEGKLDWRADKPAPEKVMPPVIDAER